MSKSSLAILFFSMLLPAAEASTVYEPIRHWIESPNERDPAVHLAFFEVVKVVSEQYTATNVPNYRASYDGGKTWTSLLKLRHGVMTINMIESPGVAMPQMLDINFQEGIYVATPETPLPKLIVQPGKRFLALFRKDPEGKWSLEHPGVFSEPLIHLVVPSEAEVLHSYFKTSLASEAAVSAKRMELYPASGRAGQPAPTNAPAIK
jgi:hypothetical protein